jgi:hypothetical protein
MTKKLSSKDWEEIKKLLENEDRNISQIAKDFGISRNSVYVFANRRGWLAEEQKPQETGFFSKILNKIGLQKAHNQR